MPSGFHFFDNRGLKLGKLVEIAQCLIRALGFRFVDAADGEADVDENVIANLRLRNILQTGLARYAAELHLGHAHAARIVGFKDFAGYGQTHFNLLAVTARWR